MKNKSRPQTIGKYQFKAAVLAQRGYIMVSLMILLFVTAALLTLYVERQTERSRLDRGEQIGYALGVLGAGLNAYLNQNYTELAADKPIVKDIVNPLQPTAEDLIRTVNIRGVAPVPPVIADASYRFLVSYPAGCKADQRRYDVRCRPTGLAYIDKPLKRGTTTDYVALARAARVMQGKGGYARPESPSRFTFPDSVAAPPTISIANPTRVAGILAWRADTLPEDEEHLKTNGSNRMNSALRLNGKGVDHDLMGAKDITASGVLVTKALSVTQNSETRGHHTVGGQLYVKGFDPESASGMQVERNAVIGGNLTVGGETRTDILHFSETHRQGASCDTSMAISREDSGQLLQCKGRRWVPLIDDGGSRTIGFDAPSGFLVDLNKYYFNMGYWTYCRDAIGSSILWTEGNLWRSSVFGNSGWHTVVCFGRLPP